jgi:hypothetical protein
MISFRNSPVKTSHRKVGMLQRPKTYFHDVDRVVLDGLIESRQAVGPKKS